MKDGFPITTRSVYLSGDITARTRCTIRRERLDFGLTLLFKNSTELPGNVGPPPPGPPEELAPPRAIFSFSNRIGQVPLTITVRDRSIGEIDDWYWTFGDGAVSTDPDPGTHEYTEVGRYTVSLTVTNGGGSDTFTRIGYVNVSEEAGTLVADFSMHPTQGQKPLTVIVEENSTGDPDEWYWTWDDGTFSTEPNPGEHVYEEDGDYSPSLKVTRSGGETDTMTTPSDYISVGGGASDLVADFSMHPRMGLAPLTVQIEENSGGGPTGWNWTYDDGDVSDVQDPIEHTYETDGNYSPSLEVTRAGEANEKLTPANYIVALPLIPDDALYVSKSGNDGTGDGSEDAPWKTIQHGVNNMSAGDTLFIRGHKASYKEVVIFKDMEGRPNAYYRVAAFPGDVPRIDGGYNLPSGNYAAVDPKTGLGFVYKALVKFNGVCKYIWLDGLDIRQSRGTGIKADEELDTSSNIRIWNCKIHHTRGATTKFSRVHSLHIKDCELYESMNYCTEQRHACIGLPWAGAMTIIKGSDVLVEGNLVYNSYGEGIHPFTWDSGVVQDNVVFNCMNGMLPITCCQNTTVQRNFVYSTGDDRRFLSSLGGFTMEAGKNNPSRAKRSKDCKYINNILVNGTPCCRLMDRLANPDQGDHYQPGFGFYRNSIYAHNTLVRNAYRKENPDQVFPTKWLKMHNELNDLRTMDFYNNIYWADPENMDLIKYGSLFNGSPAPYHHNCWIKEPPESQAKGAGDIYENPRLVEPLTTVTPLSSDGSRGYHLIRQQAERFRIKSGSPARGAGQGGGVVEDDFWGNQRDPDNPCMGAHERGS